MVRQTMPQRLRALLARDSLTVLPGCGDALSAKVIEEAGFDAVFMSGFWTAATKGLLDVGLITLGEMVQNATYISRAVDIPLICDADTGFGDGALQIRRCVGDFEAAGTAGITLEDQTLQKKCGLRKKKNVVPISAMTTKLDAAVAARTDPDFVIVARTDALESEGLERAILRGSAYLEAGADLLFVEGFGSEEQVEAVTGAFPRRQVVYNQAPPGYGPQIGWAELDKLGVAVALFPAHLALAALTVQRELLSRLASGAAAFAPDAAITSIDDLSRLLGENNAVEFESRFALAPQGAGAQAT